MGQRPKSKVSSSVALESVISRLGDFTRDAIIVSEAEPLALPGPRIAWVNAAFVETTGYTSADVIGQTPRIFQGPGTSIETRERIRAKLDRWEHVHETILNYRRDGTPFWVDLSILPVSDESGWFHYWVSIQRDVTEQVERQEELKRAHADLEKRAIALRRATELLRMGFSASGDGIWDWDVERDQFTISDEAAAQIGYNELNVRPSLAELEAGIHPDDWPDIKRELVAVASGTPDAFQKEFRVAHINGGFRWILSRGKVVERGFNGRVRRVVGTHKDIHAGKILEQRLSLALVRSQAADLAKTQFLRLMSHEIRTPLNAILGLSEVMMRTNPDTGVRDNAAMIKEAGDRLAELLLNAITLVSNEAEDAPPVALRFDLRDVIATAARVPFRIAGEKGIQTLTRFKSDVENRFFVISDPARLERIVAILASNAAKFTTAGTIAIEAALSGETCTLKVTDSGIGISPNQLKRIFDPFTTSGSELTRSHEGAGLGLAACRALIQSMGGTISVDTEQAKGTTFTVSLPLRRALPVSGQDPGMDDEASAHRATQG